MNDLLNAALEATNAKNSPIIVSENHDHNSINWVAGMSDPGEMIACGAYQELRRVANESDEVYQYRISQLLKELPPEHAAKIHEAGVLAAQQRAGYDLSNGRVNLMVAGAAAWTRLGVNVQAAVSSQHARRLGGLMFEMDLIPLYYRNPITGVQDEQANKFAIVRKDTGACLGTVGTGYKIIQNDESFDLLDDVLSEFGAKYETAGSVFGGEKGFMLVHLPKQGFSVKGSDRTECYAALVKSNNGTESDKLFPTTQRIVCANTMRIALNKDRGKGITMTHRGDIKQKADEARKALGLAVKATEKFATNAQAMAEVKMMDPIPYFDGVLDKVLDITAADVSKGASVLAAALAATDADIAAKEAQIQRQIDKRKGLLEEVLERYHSETNGVNGIRGTVYSAYNSLTESVDHGKLGGRFTGSTEDRKSRQFESTLYGNGDEIKQISYQHAVAALKA